MFYPLQYAIPTRNVGDFNVIHTYKFFVFQFVLYMIYFFFIDSSIFNINPRVKRLSRFVWMFLFEMRKREAMAKEQEEEIRKLQLEVDHGWRLIKTFTGTERASMQAEGGKSRKELVLTDQVLEGKQEGQDESGGASVNDISSIASRSDDSSSLFDEDTWPIPMLLENDVESSAAKLRSSFNAISGSELKSSEQKHRVHVSFFERDEVPLISEKKDDHLSSEISGTAGLSSSRKKKEKKKKKKKRMQDEDRTTSKDTQKKKKSKKKSSSAKKKTISGKKMSMKSSSASKASKKKKKKKKQKKSVRYPDPPPLWAIRCYHEIRTLLTSNLLPAIRFKYNCWFKKLSHHYQDETVYISFIFKSSCETYS